MKKNYRYLTDQDRIFLRVMLEKNFSKEKIANILKVNRSTIYRELKRNCFKHWRSKGNDALGAIFRSIYKMAGNRSYRPFFRKQNVIDS